MATYYNVWYISSNRWTNARYYGPRAEFHGKEQDTDNPFPLTEAEARAWMANEGFSSAEFMVKSFEVHGKSAPPTPRKIYSCSRCGHFNEYAEPNMPDGTYKCKSCRDNPWR